MLLLIHQIKVRYATEYENDADSVAAKCVNVHKMKERIFMKGSSFAFGKQLFLQEVYLYN